MSLGEGAVGWGWCCRCTKITFLCHIQDNYILLHMYANCTSSNLKYKSIQVCPKSISRSVSKSHILNHHLESHLHKNRFLYLFTLQQFFYISCALQRATLIFYFWLAKNPEYKMGYIWMTIQRSCWRVVFHLNLYSQHLGRIWRVSWRWSKSSSFNSDQQSLHKMYCLK